MTSFLPNRKTFLETIIEHSFVQAKEKIIGDLQNQINEKILVPSNKKMNACYTSYSPSTGSQVFKISENSLLLKENRFLWEGYNSWYTTNNNEERRQQHIYPFPDANVFNIVTLDGTYSMEHCIEIIKDVYEASKDTFYGCLLKSNSTGQYVNALHPLIAQAQICSEKPLSGTFKIIIFTIDKNKFDTYEKEKEKLRNDATQDTHHQVPAGELFSKKYDNIFYNSIISNIGTIVEEEQYHTRVSRIIPSNDMLNVKYETRSYDKDGNEVNESSSEDSFYLIPIQLINTGMAFPYYGVVEIKEPIRGLTRGMQLSPMQSCNIGMQHIDSNGISMYGSVCTGNLATNSNNGRKSLSHANLSSPFFREVLVPGAMRYAQISNQISLSLYGRMFNIGSTEFDFDGVMKAPIPEKMSFDEYKSNTGLGLIDYLKYIKSIREAELENEKED